MELVAVAIMLVLSSVLAAAAARGVMAVMFFLLMRSASAPDEIKPPLPTANSQGTGLAASV